MTKNNVGEIDLKTTGHDYAFSEIGGVTYRWELEAPTVHPMMINNELTMLIKIDDSEVPSEMTGNYYADGDDGWTLFSPFAIPNKNELSNLTNKQ